MARGAQVVGAGRGPLVRASLKAAAETGRRIRVFAVEKNPNAVVTLQNLVASGRVHVSPAIVYPDVDISALFYSLQP